MEDDNIATGSTEDTGERIARNAGGIPIPCSSVRCVGRSLTRSTNRCGETADIGESNIESLPSALADRTNVLCLPGSAPGDASAALNSAYDQVISLTKENGQAYTLGAYGNPWASFRAGLPNDGAKTNSYDRGS
jgi:hypothetical protein